jgi:hypothetical protein
VTKCTNVNRVVLDVESHHRTAIAA